MSTLEEIQRKLGTKPVQGAPDENPIIHSKGNGKKIDRRHFNKRTPGTGKRANEENLVVRGIRAKIDEYSQTDVELEVTDPKTGLTRKIKKPRIMWAIETFFELGMEIARKNKDITGITVLDKFLDRAVGRAAQPLRGDGEDDAPIKIQGVDIAGILKKAYGEQRD